jgi:hypothetical protein
MHDNRIWWKERPQQAGRSAWRRSLGGRRRRTSRGLEVGAVRRAQTPRGLVVEAVNSARTQNGHIRNDTRDVSRHTSTDPNGPICRKKCVPSDPACTGVTPRNFHGKEAVPGSSPGEGLNTCKSTLFDDSRALSIREGLGRSSRLHVRNSLQIAPWPDSAEHLRGTEVLCIRTTVIRCSGGRQGRPALGGSRSRMVRAGVS